MQRPVLALAERDRDQGKREHDQDPQHDAAPEGAAAAGGKRSRRGGTPDGKAQHRRSCGAVAWHERLSLAAVQAVSAFATGAQPAREAADLLRSLGAPRSAGTRGVVRIGRTLPVVEEPDDRETSSSSDRAAASATAPAARAAVDDVERRAACGRGRVDREIRRAGEVDAPATHERGDDRRRRRRRRSRRASSACSAAASAMERTSPAAERGRSPRRSTMPGPSAHGAPLRDAVVPAPPGDESGRCREPARPRARARTRSAGRPGEAPRRRARRSGGADPPAPRAGRRAPLDRRRRSSS